MVQPRKHRPKYRRGQHGSHRQGRRHPKGVQQLSQEPVCISRHAVAHGVIDTSPRNQGEKCYQQIAGNRAAAQPGHDLRKDAYGHRSQERGHDAAARQQIHQPAQSSPEAAIDKQYVEADSQFRVVRTFKSGGEALAHLPKLKADLIILDYYTPGMNGTEFVDQLHTLGESPFIIAVTSANDTHIVQGLLARGVLDYLVKPFQFPRFRQALDRFLQARRLLEQGPGSMDQSAIDQLVHHREALPPGTPLDKGVNFSTLSRIRRFFDENPEHFFTSEQIAEHVGLSRITVRRYVNYMVDQGEITSSIDYQTGGRPSIRYLRLHS